MPTKEHMATVAEHIRDVIGRRYIEGDGNQCSCWFRPEGGGPVGMGLFQGVPVGTPEPFADLPYRGKIELLITYVHWKGFSLSQESRVSHRVIDGESPDVWMDSIAPSRNEKALFAEIMQDTSLRKMPEDPTISRTYDQQLQDATERGDRQRKEQEGHER